MKLTQVLLPVVAGALFTATANAQVNITITGSTSFRAIAFDRAAALFDTGFVTYGNTGTGPGTYVGTMHTAVPSLGNTPVTMRLSFSGSGAGMVAVANRTAVPTVENATGGTGTAIPDLAFSDVFPESATPPVNRADVEDSVVGVIPFVFVRNNALTGINNITREQAILLMTASGTATVGGQTIPGMPASFLGGASSNPIYNVGRDSGSGTRITVLKDIGFTGTPTMWGLDAANNLVLTNGYSSGGTERVVIANNANAIGYLGLVDAGAISATATIISYNGVVCNPANVQTGKYPLWGYEHLVNRANGLSANQAAIRDALVAKITDQTFQTTNPLYTGNFVDQANMHVERGTDGGSITSLDF